MYEIKVADKPAPDKGSYNDFPPNWREIDQKAFVQGQFFRFVPVRIDFRQMLAKKEDGTKEFNKPYVGAWLYWFPDGTGVAMSDDYWKGTIKYFAFGCDHKYVELSQAQCRERKIYHAGRCYHVSECSNCHHINAVDSSD